MIHDHHGQPKDVVGFWSEVTARKTAEQAALAASEQRLTDAIESISEGFSLYDAQDRLVLGNYKYKELFDHGEGPPKPGMTYEEILRTVVESGLIQDARSRPEAWLEERLAQHRNPGEPVLEHRANGSWIQVSERRVARLNADGSLDTTFDPGAGPTTSTSIAAIAQQTDGRIIVAGQEV